MKMTAALAILALAACSGSPSAPPPSPSASPNTPAGAAEPVAQVPNNADAAVEAQVRTLLAPPPNSGLKLETTEVDVDLTDPHSQRAIVSYLLRPETWSLVKVDMVAPTRRVYRFQRVVSSSGAALPDLDPLKPR
jgi:hypothetical protein